MIAEEYFKMLSTLHSYLNDFRRESVYIIILFAVCLTCATVSTFRLADNLSRFYIGGQSNFQLDSAKNQSRSDIYTLNELEDRLSNILYGGNVQSIFISVPSEYGNWSTHILKKVTHNVSCHHLQLFNSSSLAACGKKQNKRTLILIHGYGASSVFVWRSVLNKILDKYDEVIAVDLPGFGRSSAPETLFHTETSSSDTIDMYCEWIVNLQKAFNLTTSPYIVGHSFGGYLAIQCVSRHPYLASRLLLADVPGIFNTNGGYDWYWMRLFGLGLPQSLLRSLGPLAKPFVDTIMYFSGVPMDQIFVDYWLTLQLNNLMKSEIIVSKFLKVHYFRTFGYNPAIIALMNITVPVTLLYGELDNLSPWKQGQVLCEVGRFGCISIPKAGHLPYVRHVAQEFVDVRNWSWICSFNCNINQFNN